MINVVEDIKEALDVLSIPGKAEVFLRFFKTGKGEYGEGDVFIGVTVPDQRKVANSFYSKINLDDLSTLLSSQVHEHRLTALLILTQQFEKTKDLKLKKQIVDFYINHLQYVNNWDLVDTSCYKILGRYCYETNQANLLEDLSRSQDMWHKRVAIVGTMYYIKKGQFTLTQQLALQNLNHTHDLMHKANGWLLREMGKKDEILLIDFLKQHYHNMPRTSLRYAIEKLDEDLRQDFLKGKV